MHFPASFGGGHQNMLNEYAQLDKVKLASLVPTELCQRWCTIGAARFGPCPWEFPLNNENLDMPIVQ